MWRAKFRQATLAVRGGRATLPYPAVPRPPAVGFRGLPDLDAARCLGCGLCAHACPSRLIRVGLERGRLLFAADFARCVYCARCAEVCPAGAISMTDRFETAVKDPSALRMEAELPLAACSRCGRSFGVAAAMVSFLPGGELCPTCRRRAQAARLKGVARRV